MEKVLKNGDGLVCTIPSRGAFIYLFIHSSIIYLFTYSFIYLFIHLSFREYTWNTKYERFLIGKIMTPQRLSRTLFTFYLTQALFIKYADNFALFYFVLLIFPVLYNPMCNIFTHMLSVALTHWGRLTHMCVPKHGHSLVQKFKPSSEPVQDYC